MKSIHITKNGREYEVFRDGTIYREAFTDTKGHNRKRREVTPTKHYSGYILFSCSGKKYPLHRLVAEAFLQDYSPDLQVDHIDGDKNNNAVGNLRMVTHTQNARAYQPIRGEIPYRGVRKDGKKFMAVIRANKEQFYLGSHRTPEEAAKAYDKKALELGFFPEALNFPS